VRDAFPDIRVVAYVDDVHLQDPPEAATDSLRLLVTATALIGLTPSLPKCAAYVQSAATGSAVASALGIAHRPEGLVAAGTPLGLDAFVEADARSWAETVAGLVTALASLPLGSSGDTAGNKKVIGEDQDVPPDRYEACAYLADHGEPPRYEWEAQNGPEGDKWKVACWQELTSMAE
jgi:hypothetical protein